MHHAASRRRFRYAGPLAIVTLLLVLALVDVPICPSRVLYGIPCPGCGLTRATLAMLRWDWGEVWQYHPAAPLVTPVFVGLLLRPSAADASGGPQSATRRWARRVGRVSVGLSVLALVGVYATRAAGFWGGLPDAVSPASGILSGPMWSLLGRVVG